MAGRTLLNQKARKLIADYCERNNIVNCENCGGNFGMAPAHKENRRFYRTVEELADPNNWIALCQKCHIEIESNKDKTEALFSKLRG
jgi:hypothetical protein